MFGPLIDAFRRSEAFEANRSKSKKGERTMASTSTKSTKKAAKVAAASNGKAKAERNGGLTGTEVKTLTALAKVESANRDKLRATTGVQKGWSKILGASSKEDFGSTGSDSLCGRGLVKVLQIEGDRQYHYAITPAGRKALEKAKKG